MPSKADPVAIASPQTPLERTRRLSWDLRLSRRQLIMTGAGCAMAAGAYPLVVEPRWLEVTHTPVRIGNDRGEPIRILHLSDLHRSWFVPLSMIHHAITLGLAEKPDLIAVTGDFITHNQEVGFEKYADCLSRLSAAAPSFAVLGNHDGGEWASGRFGYADHRHVEDLVKRAGIDLLHNRCLPVSVRGRTVNLAGVGDLWSKEVNSAAAFRGIEPGAPVVLLAHNPDSKEALRGRSWDLMLAGHTHGGQIVIPFEGPKYAPVNDFRYIAGLGSWEGRQIFVTRGVGNVGGVRFRCRPEVSILDVFS